MSKREKDRPGGLASPPRLEPEAAAASAGHWKPSVWTLVFQRSLVAFVGLLLIVWIVPATLDWNRYRNAIAGFAAAELGRPVSIGGGVTLRLLPRAILTAADVTFPDQGDGVSARLHALRLEVSIWPLLRGHLVVRDLVLGEPVLRLPWPLPPDLGTPVSPYVRHPFTARVEHGGLELGGVALTGVDASLRSEAATGALQIRGAAQVAGAPWRFVTSLGAPGADDRAALTVQVTGLDAFRGTAGRFDGTLAVGTLTGRVDGGGPDLPRLIASPAGPWHASGAFKAVAGRLELPDLALAVPGWAGARARAVLHITGRAGLDLRLDGTDIDAMPWANAVAGLRAPALPMRLSLGAAHVRLLAGILDDVAATVSWDGNAALLEQGRAILPGHAELTLAGKAGRGADGVSIDGPASLDAPDLHSTLAWLHPLAPSLIGPPAGRWLSSVKATGALHLSPRGLSVSGMSGTLDGTPVSGAFGIGFAATPGFGAGLVMDHVDLEEWAAALPGWPGFDGDIALRVLSARWHGQDLGALEAAVHGGNGGVSVDRLTLSGPAGTLAASGRLNADGSLADGHVRASATDLDRFAAAAARLGMPAALLHPGLWQGNAALEITASGPPASWAVQLHADVGDVRLETQAAIDAATRHGTATITLRHPGAPRLLASLGAAAPERWLDTGSFALLAHLSATPTHVRVTDMDITAALLRLSGHAEADFAQAAPSVEAWLDADTLPLPWREAVPAAWLQGWSGTLHIQAEQVLADLLPVASQLRTDVTVQGGALLADPVKAAAGSHGSITGAAAADMSQIPAKVAARLAFSGIDLTGHATGLPMDIGGGGVSGTADLAASGADAAAWIASAGGSFVLHVQDAQALGIDLARVSRLTGSRQPAPRASLANALTAGTTGGLEGALSGAIGHGRVSLAQFSLASPAGTLGITGTLALDGSNADLAIAVIPAVPAPPPLRVLISGPWAAAKVQAELPRPPPTPPRRKAGRAPAKPR